MFLEQSVLLVLRQEAQPIAILLLWYLYVHESESESHSVMSDSLRLHGLYSSWNSPGQNTGVGSLSLLQESSQPRDRTQVSHIAGGFFR